MTLEEVRKQIDKVDKEIKILFKERMELADHVAEIKAQTADAIFKPDREVAIIEKQSADVTPEIRQEYVALIKRIMEISRKYQYGRTLELRHCLGIEWDTELPAPQKVAMIKPELYICNIISKDDVITVDSFEQVGELISTGRADAGVGILEDVGRRVSNGIHALLVSGNFYINKCRVVQDGDIRKKVILFTTRLVVMPEHNRMKIMFVCPNKSGALASILSMISDYNVNLTEIHSRPNHEADWNYEFFLEIEGCLLDQNIQNLMFQLQNETQYFRILGSYACNGDF